MRSDIKKTLPKEGSFLTCTIHPLKLVQDANVIRYLQAAYKFLQGCPRYHREYS